VGQGEDALAVAEVSLFHAALQAVLELQAVPGLHGERRVRWDMWAGGKFAI